MTQPTKNSDHETGMEGWRAVMTSETRTKPVRHSKPVQARALSGRNVYRPPPDRQQGGGRHERHLVMVWVTPWTGLAWPTRSTMLRAEVLAAQGRPIKAGQ